MNELLGLPYSPWSEKAKWALEARGVAYRFKTYQPLLGEPMLRLKTGRWAGKVTVPVLTTDDGTTLTDSLDIARWADGRGEGPALFPAGRDAEVLAWVERSERALFAGRALSLARTSADPAALLEMVPRPLRGTGALARGLALFGIRRTLRKYGATRAANDAHEAALTAELEALRAALASAPRAAAAADATPVTLLGAFSFADVAATQCLAFVCPPAFGLRIGPANRRAFTDEPLRERFRDLVAWRDAVYEKHRPRSP